MELTRREFAVATAGGLLLFSLRANARSGDLYSRVGGIRHAHVELPEGPHRCAEVLRFVSCAADVIGLPAPKGISILGSTSFIDPLPRSFVLTCSYSDGRRLVVRASPLHQGAAELTLRGQRNDREFRYFDGRFQQQPSRILSIV